MMDKQLLFSKAKIFFKNTITKVYYFSIFKKKAPHYTNFLKINIINFGNEKDNLSVLLNKRIELVQSFTNTSFLKLIDKYKFYLKLQNLDEDIIEFIKLEKDNRIFFKFFQLYNTKFLPHYYNFRNFKKYIKNELPKFDLVTLSNLINFHLLNKNSGLKFKTLCSNFESEMRKFLNRKGNLINKIKFKENYELINFLNLAQNVYMIDCESKHQKIIFRIIRKNLLKFLDTMNTNELILVLNCLLNNNLGGKIFHFSLYNKIKEKMNSEFDLHEKEYIYMINIFYLDLNLNLRYNISLLQEKINIANLNFPKELNYLAFIFETNQKIKRGESIVKISVSKFQKNYDKFLNLKYHRITYFIDMINYFYKTIKNISEKDKNIEEIQNFLLKKYLLLINKAINLQYLDIDKIIINITSFYKNIEESHKKLFLINIKKTILELSSLNKNMLIPLNKIIKEIQKDDQFFDMMIKIKFNQS